MLVYAAVFVFGLIVSVIAIGAIARYQPALLSNLVQGKIKRKNPSKQKNETPLPPVTEKEEKEERKDKEDNQNLRKRPSPSSVTNGVKTKNITPGKGSPQPPEKRDTPCPPPTSIQVHPPQEEDQPKKIKKEMKSKPKPDVRNASTTSLPGITREGGMKRSASEKRLSSSFKKTMFEDMVTYHCPC